PYPLEYLFTYTCFRCFFSTPTTTPKISTLSLHDALPIFHALPARDQFLSQRRALKRLAERRRVIELISDTARTTQQIARSLQRRSEEHTSELQSPCNLVCRLLLEKKNK